MTDPPTAVAKADEREMLELIDARDEAEQAISQAYYLVIGRSPEWSNKFGHQEALDEIKDACELLRKASAPPPALAYDEEAEYANFIHQIGFTLSDYPSEHKGDLPEIYLAEWTGWLARAKLPQPNRVEPSDEVKDTRIAELGEKLNRMKGL